MIISLDTEATGLDLHHGAMPFLVTTCGDDRQVRFWEWDVDPITRQPNVPQEDVRAIQSLIDSSDLIYTHNGKYDYHALRTIGVDLPWEKFRDTLVASHILGSNHSHKLKDKGGLGLCERYLGKNIQYLEDAVEDVVKKCRTIAKRNYPDWKLAEEGLSDMPSVKSSSKRDEDKPWKNDMWLPRALAPYVKDCPTTWMTVCSNYANGDSAHTLVLGLELEKLLRERGYWDIYLHRLELVRADAEMEEHGITARGDYTDATLLQYEQHVSEVESVLVSIAADYGHQLELAEGAALNDNMRDFFYGAYHQLCPHCSYFKRVKHWSSEVPEHTYCPKCIARKRGPVKVQLQEYKQDNLKLKPIYNGKSKGPSLDKDSMQEYLATTEGAAYDFINLLDDKRMHDTAIGYMLQYKRFWIPVDGYPDFYRIHTHFNPCGTDHLRQSSNGPNMQNVSSDTKELSNKECFGPLPHREWWRMDYKSIEARIPAYESGEPKLLKVFENPDEPPYFGSTYLLAASIFYPDKFAPHADKKDSFKKNEPRLYKRSKFFWLARQYGAGKRKGDLLAGFSGASNLMEEGLPLLTKLQTYYLNFAERMGYVETLPDRSISPKRGYPILASRTDDGRVLSTTPFNYHISGTACWAKNTALVRCADQCRKWRAEGFDAWVSLEVHDELLFDFPRGATMEENLPRAMVLRQLMEQSGDDLIPSMPLPVTAEYHTKSWARGVAV